MKIIGITGQSGSGKGHLSLELEKLGYTHADADEIYHNLLKESDALKGELTSAFGDDILTNGEINRAKLSKKVFGKQNARRLQRLNKIAHKYVAKEYIKLILAHKEQNKKGLIIDAPLLIEARMHKLCDINILVAAHKDIRVKRIMERDNISYDTALLRINSQKPVEFYSKYCHEIFINNDGDSAADFAEYIDKLLENEK